MTSGHSSNDLTMVLLLEAHFGELLSIIPRYNDPESMPNGKRKNKKKNKNTNGKNSNNEATLRLTKNVVPSHVFVPIKFWWSTSQIKNNGFQVASTSLRVNAPYDPDPGLGGGVTAIGFNEWSQFFSTYRVHRVHTSVEFVNLDSIGTYCAISYTNINPTANTWGQDYWNNVLSVSKRLGQSTGYDLAKLQLSASIVDITGSISTRYSDAFQSAVNTVPANIVWLVIALDSGLSSYTMVNGASVKLQITMETEFFERKILSA